MVSDKVVLITGAASGIGYEIGVDFLREGAKVAFIDINENRLNKALEVINDYDCIGLQCDVSKEDELKIAIDKTIEQYGKIDVLINNAGLQHVASVEDFPADKFEEMIQVMLVAPFVASKYVLPTMKKEGWGRIINISSIWESCL
ncbi:3-hydroxybutyrate dehydrogenase [Salinibacillus kushneri]|uniref:3-hydroxybutyrate dehydrogenase n=1 Tax=Salinibacillus kushneri TaxID=237682 RepID=A0A1I0ADU8_9BACI|nr:3-hydroxybutyrate dehydrogenase [Salinibacillus kushneri]